MSVFKNILVALDMSKPAPLVVERAARLAEISQASLTLVDGVPHLSWAQRMAWNDSEHVQELILREKTSQLKKLASSLRRRGIAVRYKVLVGRTWEELVRQVLRGKHDLLIRATKGQHSVLRGAFGSTAMELLRKCPCPVWLVHPEQEGPIERVLAAVDTNPERASHAELDARVLEMASVVAQSLNARLDVLHVWSVYGERVVKDYMKSHEFAALETAMHKEHGECLQALLARSSTQLAPDQVHLVRGEATVEIPQFAAEHNVDLVVMGTLARAGVAGMLMGNTSEMVLHQLNGSVLAVKPPGYVSPAKRTTTAGTSRNFRSTLM